MLAYFTRAEPRAAPPSGWALALDAAVAVGAAVGAVYEMMQRNLTHSVFIPAGLGPGAVGRAVQAAVRDGTVQLIPGRVIQAGSPHASSLLLIAAALTALPLAWRRLYPVAAWLVIIAAIVAAHSAYVPPVALGTAVYGAYSAMTHSRYRNLAIAVVTVSTFVAAGALGNELPRFPGRFTAVFAIFPAVAAGLGIRELRRRLADSTARLHRAADEAAAATERALAAERERIAAELHDVVTHNVSVMIVQAGAARKIMASSPADAEDALLAVESTGREAMTELRNLLGLLNPVAALRPQPGLGELDTLIGRVSSAGLPVELEVSGVPRPLSPGADLAAYRVVQEGLTNVLRHAGGAPACVRVRWDDRLEITVTDDGTPTVGTPAGADLDGADLDDGGLAGGRAAGPGRGLLGLRERLALYGGELAAGPRPQSGWRLRAVLPVIGPDATGAPG